MAEQTAIGSAVGSVYGVEDLRISVLRLIVQILQTNTAILVAIAHHFVILRQAVATRPVVPLQEHASIITAHVRYLMIGSALALRALVKMQLLVALQLAVPNLYAMKAPALILLLAPAVAYATRQIA